MASRSSDKSFSLSGGFGGILAHFMPQQGPLWQTFSQIRLKVFDLRDNFGVGTHFEALNQGGNNLWRGNILG
jgi:hypothetical protein